MASLSNKVFEKIAKVSLPLRREVHQDRTVVYLSRKWRQDRKLPANPNSFGPLANLPDYSFKNGRPVPYGTNQKRRIDEQRLNYIKIKELAGQIDYAVERHAFLQRQEEEKRKQILDSKLKEKGSKLLLSSNKKKE